MEAPRKRVSYALERAGSADSSRQAGELANPTSSDPIRRQESTMGNVEDQRQNEVSDMLARLEGEDLQGLSPDDVKQAMSHPKAAETIAELQSYDASAVKLGEPAPDFSLAYLPGSRPGSGREGARLTLSDHFGSRPVALIFGSYT
jgi:hypothetical protein